MLPRALPPAPRCPRAAGPGSRERPKKQRASIQVLAICLSSNFSSEVLDDLRQRAFELAQGLFTLSGPHAVCNAGIHMVFEQPGSRLIDGSPHRRKLNQQVIAARMLAQHALDTAHVALDPAEAVLQLLFDLGIKVDIFHYR